MAHEAHNVNATASMGVNEGFIAWRWSQTNSYFCCKDGPTLICISSIRKSVLNSVSMKNEGTPHVNCRRELFQVPQR